jgi:hypothetical protein
MNGTYCFGPLSRASFEPALMVVTLQVTEIENFEHTISDMCHLLTIYVNYMFKKPLRVAPACI